MRPRTEPRPGGGLRAMRASEQATGQGRGREGACRDQSSAVKAALTPRQDQSSTQSPVCSGRSGSAATMRARRALAPPYEHHGHGSDASIATISPVNFSCPVEKVGYPV